MRSHAWLVWVTLAVLGCTTTTPSQENQPQIEVAPGALDFGTVVPSSPALSMTLTITNTGSTALEVQGATATPSDVFAVQGVPLQVNIGMSGMIMVVMTPPAQTGALNGSLVISSNAGNTPQFSVPLRGVVSLALQDGGPTPHPDAGGLEDAGADAGGVDGGPLDAGLDAGAVDSGPADSGPADAGCPSGEASCAGECVDLRSDPLHCGTCSRACSGGNTGCVAGSCGSCAPTSGYTTLATSQGQPYALTVDSTSVYWTTATADTVMKAPVDGGAATTLASAVDFPFPQSLTPGNITNASGNVYFGNQSMGTAMQVSTTGGFPVSYGGNGAPGKIAIDATAVYWVTTTTGDVWSATLAGGVGSIIVPGPTAVSAGEQYELVGVDATSVYWLSTGSAANAHRDGALMKAGLGGGTPTTVLAGISSPTDGTVDATHVYWTSSVDGTVMELAKTGGPASTLASGLLSPRNVVVDASNAYWAAGTPDPTVMSCSGTVQRVALGGGAVSNVVAGQYSAWALAVDQASLYWTDLYGGTVMKTAK